MLTMIQNRRKCPLNPDRFFVDHLSRCFHRHHHCRIFRSLALRCTAHKAVTCEAPTIQMVGHYFLRKSWAHKKNTKKNKTITRAGEIKGTGLELRVHLAAYDE